MWGAIHFSHLDLMQGSGDTCLSWKFGNAFWLRSTLSMWIIRQYRGNVRRCIWWVFWRTFCAMCYLCVLMCLMQCTCHADRKQPGTWSMTRSAEKTSSKLTWRTFPKFTFQPHSIFHERKEGQAPLCLSVGSSEQVPYGAHKNRASAFCTGRLGMPSELR